MSAATAQALVLEGPRKLLPREFSLPDVGEDEGLLRVEACGLCGTDHEQYTGALAAAFAFVPGHETVGTVEVVGSRAAERWGVQTGDRVAVEVFQSCRSCGACTSGDYRRCEQHGIFDMYGFIPADRPPGLWGGYAEYQYLGPDAMILPVPDGVDPVLATVFNPLGAGIRWAVTVPGTGAGDVVAVLGPGIRGLCACAAAKDAGAAFVMVTGFGPLDAERLAIARSFGADLAVDVSEQDPVAALREAAGSLADVVVDVTAKAPSAFAQAISLARPGGTVVVAGTRGSNPVESFSPDPIVFKEIRLLGALGVDAPAYTSALGLLASRRYPFEDLPRRVVGLDGAEGLLIDMSGEGSDTPPVHGVIAP